VKLNIDRNTLMSTLDMSRIKLESDITLNASKVVDASIADNEKAWNQSADNVVRYAKHRNAHKRAIYWLEYVMPTDPAVSELEAETARALLGALLAHVEIV